MCVSRRLQAVVRCSACERAFPGQPLVPCRRCSVRGLTTILCREGCNGESLYPRNDSATGNPVAGTRPVDGNSH